MAIEAIQNLINSLSIKKDVGVWSLIFKRVLTNDIEVLTANRTILPSENGRTFYLNNTTGFQSILPPPFLGARFTFINQTANTTANHTVVTYGSANIIKGNQFPADGAAGDTGTADDTCIFAPNQSVAGDRLELYSDGTSWFAYAYSRVAAGMSFSQVS